VEPGEIPGLTGVTTVISGTAGAALKTDGTVWVWGSNMNGGLGNGRADSSVAKVPVRVPGLANVTALSGASLGRHFVALLKDGTLRTWGNSDWGQGGVGISGTSQPAVSMPKLTGVKAAFAAGNNSFAVREDGSAWIWGVGHTWPEGPEWPLGDEATKAPRPLVLPK